MEVINQPSISIVLPCLSFIQMKSYSTCSFEPCFFYSILCMWNSSKLSHVEDHFFHCCLLFHCVNIDSLFFHCTVGGLWPSPGLGYYEWSYYEHFYTCLIMGMHAHLCWLCTWRWSAESEDLCRLTTFCTKECFLSVDKE